MKNFYQCDEQKLNHTNFEHSIAGKSNENKRETNKTSSFRLLIHENFFKCRFNIIYSR